MGINLEIEKIKKVIKSDYFFRYSNFVDDLGWECEDKDLDVDKLANAIYKNYAKLLIEENNLLKELLDKWKDI